MLFVYQHYLYNYFLLLVYLKLFTLSYLNHLSFNVILFNKGCSGVSNATHSAAAAQTAASPKDWTFLKAAFPAANRPSEFQSKAHLWPQSFSSFIHSFITRSHLTQTASFTYISRYTFTPLQRTVVDGGVSAPCWTHWWSNDVWVSASASTAIQFNCGPQCKHNTIQEREG